MKICNKCKNEKELIDFGKETRNKNGLRSWCKLCVSKQNKTPEAKAAILKYKQSEKGKQKKREYRKLPKTKALRKLYRQRPEVKKIEQECSKNYKIRFNELRNIDKEQRIKCNNTRKEKAGNMKKHLREQVILEEPNCRKCGNPSNVIDHIISVYEGGKHTRENLQRLCHKCNKIKTALEARERRLQSWENSDQPLLVEAAKIERLKMINNKDTSIIPYGPCCCGCQDVRKPGMCKYWSRTEEQKQKDSATCNYLGVTEDDGYLFEGLKICNIHIESNEE